MRPVLLGIAADTLGGGFGAGARRDGARAGAAAGVRHVGATAGVTAAAVAAPGVRSRGEEGQCGNREQMG